MFGINNDKVEFADIKFGSLRVPADAVNANGPNANGPNGESQENSNADGLKANEDEELILEDAEEVVNANDGENKSQLCAVKSTCYDRNA